jgi:death-on-curing protein
MTRYLSLSEVLLIQDLQIQQAGGIRGITEVGFGKLEAVLAAPQHSMFGEELYPDLPAKAAIFFYTLLRSHCFSDGNKRTALIALLEFLERNDARLARVEDDELFGFVMQAAADLGRDQVRGWLADHIELAAPTG